MTLNNARKSLRAKYEGIALKPHVVRTVHRERRRGRIPKEKRFSARMKKAPEGLAERLEAAKKGMVGHCYFFDNIVVFGDPRQLSRRMQGQLGEYLGRVYCLMPSDPYHITYEWLTPPKSTLRRRGGQKGLDRYVWPGKPKIVVRD